MSITFWMPQAPLERVQPYPDEPDYWEQRPVWPFCEINMTAGNANAILQLTSPGDMNWDEDPHGEWDQTKLASIRRHCIYALSTKHKDSAVSESTREVGARGAVMMSCGRDADYVVRRLNDFLQLTKVAMEHGFTVVFG